MNDRQQDPELRARFDELKRLDATRAPAFETVWTRAQEAVAREAAVPFQTRRAHFHRIGWAAGLAAAAAIASLIMIPRARSREAAFERAVQAFHANPALGAWRSPTDGLLDLPGSRLMSSIPSVSGPQ